MKNLFKLLIVSLIFTACEDVEPTIYNGSPSDHTFLSFTSSSIDLPVVRDDEGTLTLVLNSSTVSTVDRVYNLDIDETASTADPSIYTFPSTITIPAGSYQGTAVVTAVDDLDEGVIETIVFSISNLQGESMDVEVITINLFEVCPLFAPFTGNYTVEQVQSGMNIATGGAEIFGDDNQTGGAPLPVVEIEMGGSEFERLITFDAYPEAGSGFTVDFRLRLSCGFINLTGVVDVGVGCTAGNTLKFAPGTVAASYDPNDDSVITLVITENPTSGCNASPRQITLIFTKVD